MTSSHTSSRGLGRPKNRNSNGNGHINGNGTSFTDELVNAMVSNVIIQDSLMESQQGQPPHKRMRVGLGQPAPSNNNTSPKMKSFNKATNPHSRRIANGSNNNNSNRRQTPPNLSMSNGNHSSLPVINGSNLPIFSSTSSSTGHGHIPAMAATPALSLLSEALKQMPALQSVSNQQH